MSMNECIYKYLEASIICISDEIYSILLFVTFIVASGRSLMCKRVFFLNQNEKSLYFRDVGAEKPLR